MSATARAMSRQSIPVTPRPKLGLWASLSRSFRWKLGAYRASDVAGWSDPDVLGLAEDLARRGKNKAAARILEAFSIRITADPRILQRYGDVSRALGAHETAVVSYLQTAELYAQNGLMAKASAILSQLVRLYPEQLDARVGLARALEALDRKKEAAANYAVVVQALQAQGRPQDAAPFAEKIVELWPQARAEQAVVGTPSQPPPEGPKLRLATSSSPSPPASRGLAPSPVERPSSPAAVEPRPASVVAPLGASGVAPRSSGGVARQPATAFSGGDDDISLELPVRGGPTGVAPPRPVSGFSPGAPPPPDAISLIFGRPITGSGDRPAIRGVEDADTGAGPLDLGDLSSNFSHDGVGQTMALSAISLDELIAESRRLDSLSEEELADQELARQVALEYERKMLDERSEIERDETHAYNDVDDSATVMGMAAITDEDKRAAGIGDATVGLRIPDYRSVVIDFDGEDGPKRRR